MSFQNLGGASKLVYSLSILQNLLCNYIVFLDDDKEGRQALKEAEKAQLLSQAETTFSICQEYPEAEFEDLLNPAFYAPYFQQRYTVYVTHPPFDQKKKWSDRIRFGMSKAGKKWPEKNEYEDKRAIAEMVTKAPEKALHPSKAALINSFIASVESKIAEISSGLRH